MRIVSNTAAMESSIAASLFGWCNRQKNGNFFHNFHQVGAIVFFEGQKEQYLLQGESDVLFSYHYKEGDFV